MVYVDKCIWAVSGKRVRKNCQTPMTITEATVYVVQYYIPSGGGGAYRSEGFYCENDVIWDKFINNCMKQRIRRLNICRITGLVVPIEPIIEQNIQLKDCCVIS